MTAKILAIWRIIESVLHDFEPGIMDDVTKAHDAVVSAVMDTIDEAIKAGTLPANFKQGLGNIVSELVAAHPHVLLPVSNPSQPTGSVAQSSTAQAATDARMASLESKFDLLLNHLTTSAAPQKPQNQKRGNGE